jgi:hypothetical protein
MESQVIGCNNKSCKNCIKDEFKYYYCNQHFIDHDSNGACLSYEYKGDEQEFPLPKVKL